VLSTADSVDGLHEWWHIPTFLETSLVRHECHSKSLRLGMKIAQGSLGSAWFSSLISLLNICLYRAERLVPGSQWVSTAGIGVKNRGPNRGALSMPDVIFVCGAYCLQSGWNWVANTINNRVLLVLDVELSTLLLCFADCKSKYLSVELLNKTFKLSATCPQLNHPHHSNARGLQFSLANLSISGPIRTGPR
jgi:hypothetical protein